jgi:hypothetical protein
MEMVRNRGARVAAGVGAWGLAVLLLLSSTAQAQIGTGWVPYTPTLRLQLRGCSDYSASDGIEQFHITCDATSGDNRAEQRVEDDYSSGSVQFEGEFRVASLPGNGISVKQTFQATEGAFLMIAVQNSGRFYSVGDNGTLGTWLPGEWTRINTVHDVATQTHRIYVNGELKVTKTGGSTPWYNKYGAYRIGSGHGPATIEWRNVRFWRDGNSPTPTPPPGLRYEAELIPRASFGAPTAVQSDGQNSGGRWMALLADGAGDSVEYTLPNVPAGTFDVFMKYKSHPSRGILTMQLDDVPIGPPELDQYSNPPAYPEIFLGTVRFGAPSDHIVRQMTLGKNVKSGAFTLSADVFVLLPDTTPPTVNVPEDIVVEAQSPSGAAVAFNVSAVDDKDGDVPATATPPSGSVFPLGETTVDAVATDFAGNRGTATFVVRVVDTTPPVLTVPPDITIRACDRPDIGTASATDVASTPSVTNDAPSIFPLGLTVVTWRAVDPSGNAATGTQRVTAELGDDPSCCPIGTKVIVGSAASDVILGTAGSDCILSRGGNDVINALGGDDFISGGAGNDTIVAGFGNDLVMSGPGDDVVDAGPGDDIVNAGAGRDTVAAGPGSDIIDGGSDADVCAVPPDGVDQVVGCP